MKRHIGLALAAALGLGTAPAAPAAVGAPPVGVHADKARTKCYGPYSKDKAMWMAKKMQDAGYDAWMKKGSDGWYVCVDQ